MHECSAKPYFFIKTGYVSSVKLCHYTLMDMEANSAVNKLLHEGYEIYKNFSLVTQKPICFPFCTSMTFAAKRYKQVCQHSRF